MRYRSKRLKSSSSLTEQSHSSSARRSPADSVQSGFSASQLDHIDFKVDTSQFEPGSFASRCSVRLIHEVVSNFDVFKSEIVKSIGFGGILRFPPIKQFNRKFSLWLMSCVNENTSSINISQHLSISFNKYDVGHVFGITTSGKRVLDVLADSSRAKDTVIERFLGNGFKEQKSVKIAQEIIGRQYHYPMSKEELDSFRVAFVVFVMSNLLAPSAKHDYASIDYWNAIADPDAIRCYDWSDYVISRLLEGVSKLKHDISNNIKYPNISGCSLFLQVLYLDSLELDGLSLVHNSLPRVQHFSFDLLRRMILADRNYSRHIKDDPDLPFGKFRARAGCIYSWANFVDDFADDHSSCSLFAIWESAVAIVQLLNIPLEAAGPVFVAAADFQNQINSGIAVTGTQAIKFMSVLVSVMMPYTRGFRYQNSSRCAQVKPDSGLLESAISNGIRFMSGPLRYDHKKRYTPVQCGTSIFPGSSGPGSIEPGHGCLADSSSNDLPNMLHHTTVSNHFERSRQIAWSSLDDMPHYLNVNLRVSTAMVQFYSLMRKIKPPHDFDLNMDVVEMGYSASSSSISVGTVCESVRSPWELGWSWKTDGVDVSFFKEKLSRMESDDRFAIVHGCTKCVKVVLSDMCSQFLCRCEMELDLFDSLVRLARQDDDLLFSSHGSVRWRYFFESDFMESILSGSLDLLDESIAYRLHGFSLNVDLSKCKIVFFPALLSFQWVCFAWQPEDNVISVFEASTTYPLPEPRVDVIGRATYILKLALHSLMRSSFPSFSIDVTSAEVRILNLVDCQHPRYNCSGLLCSFFYRCFDGFDLRPKIGKVDEEVVAAKLLSQLVHLKGNSGCLNQFIT